MRFMQLRRATTTLLIVLLVVITWLGLKTALASQTVDVKVLMPAPFADATKPLVDQFNQEHHGHIRLSVVKGPLETEAISDLAISSLLLGNPPFDALLMDVTWVPKYAKAGWLQPLDQWFEKAEFEQLAKGVQPGNEFEGQIVRWPFVASMGLLYWRTDLMDTPPRTPDELVNISKQLQADQKVPWGYVWQGRQYEGLSCVFLEMIHGFGGIWYDPSTGTIGLDQKPGLAAANWLTNLIKDGISPRAVANFAEAESLQSFKMGESAFMRNWPYAWAELQKEDSSVKGKVAVTTMVATSEENSAATLGSWGLSILNGTKHADETATAIRFLTSQSAQRTLAMSHGYTPTSTELFNDPELLTINPILPELSIALNHAIARPETPLYAQISDALQRNLNSSLTGESPSNQSMQETEKSTEYIIKSAGGRR